MNRQSLTRRWQELLDFPRQARNCFQTDLHVCIDRSNHPFWSTYRSDPPLPYTSPLLADLAHCFNRVPASTTKKCVVDFEHVLILSGLSRDYQAMIRAVPDITRQLLADHCRAIVVPTHGAVREIRRYMDHPDILRKVHVIRPGYPLAVPRRHVPAETFKILTIGNKFWGKGHHLAIETFRILAEKHPGRVTMTLVCSDVPEHYPLPGGLNLLDIPQLTHEIRAELYGNADVFLFPCLHDSFGVYLEAMAFGVPVITSRIYDKDELVLHDQTGYLIETPLSMYDGNFGVDWKNWDEFQARARSLFESGGFSTMISGMVDVLEPMLTHREISVRLGSAAQAFHRERFNIANRNAQILHVYRKILQ